MQFINQAIEIVQVHPTLYEINNVFNDEFLADIDARCEHGLTWAMDRRLARLSQTDHDFFEQSGREFQTLLSDLAGQEVWYRIGKLFLDLPGAEVPLHSDANDIDIMTQVYLHGTAPNLPGTTFLEPVIHSVKNNYNCGYINFNSDKKKHQSTHVVGGYRLTTAFQFYFPK